MSETKGLFKIFSSLAKSSSSFSFYRLAFFVFLIHGKMYFLAIPKLQLDFRYIRDLTGLYQILISKRKYEEGSALASPSQIPVDEEQGTSECRTCPQGREASS